MNFIYNKPKNIVDHINEQVLTQNNHVYTYKHAHEQYSLLNEAYPALSLQYFLFFYY